MRKKWDAFGIKNNFQTWWRNPYNKGTSQNIFLQSKQRKLHYQEGLLDVYAFCPSPR